MEAYYNIFIYNLAKFLSYLKFFQTSNLFVNLSHTSQLKKLIFGIQQFSFSKNASNIFF